MENNYIEIKGKQELVPDSVVDLQIYKKYREAKIDFNNHPWRNFVFATGKKIRLPYMRSKAHQTVLGATDEEVNTIDERSRELMSISCKVSVLKRRAFNYKIAQPKVKAVKGYKSRQTEENEAYMLELFGKFYSTREVHSRLAREGIKVSYYIVNNIYIKNKEKIRELRNKAKEDLDDISIGNKRSRLEKLDYLVADLLQIYTKTTSQNKLQYSKEIRGIIEQARKEVEGDELKLTVNGRIDINATIEGAMGNQKLIQNLTIIQMVLSRVSARTGVNYNKIVSRLANSFYSKFNGFRINEDLTQDPIYPSSVSYDIFEMRPIVEQLYNKEDRTYVDAEFIDEKSLAKAEIGKNTLRDLLNKRLNEHESQKMKK